MISKSRSPLLFISHIVLLGLCFCIDINFDDSKDGFFLKSPYHKLKPAEPNIVRESLILTHPAEVYKLRASYGPFEMYEVVPNDVITNIIKYGELFDKSETSMHRYIIHNMDVSAHLVSQTVSHANPVVQVLIHAQPLTQRHKQDLIYSYYGYSQRWCAQIFVSRGDEQYTSVCVLNGDSNACVAGMHVPEHWWDSANVSAGGLDVMVSYDLSRVEQNQECASMSNTIVPARADPNPPSVAKKFISAVRLVRDGFVYADHRDKDLIFRVPQGDLRPNSRFHVPVLLEKNSALKEFVIQVKVRGGLLIEGASAANNSPWNIHFEPGEKDGTAQVTAFVKEDVKYTKSFQLDEIMQWQFKVLSSSSQPAMARISWTVDYKKNGLSRNAYFSPEGSRITAKFNIVAGQIDNIVAVLKEQSIVNTAILTGKPVSHDLMVYSVSYDNTFKDVTKDSTCRSTDPESLKVAVSCDHVFLDGSETRGAKNVTILVQTAEHLAQLGVRVWVPEPRLDIQLSDSKLSQVQGWRVETPQRARSKRSVDLGLLTHSNVIVGKEKSSLNSSQNCSPKYQQSVIEVYARFIINPPGELTEYYRNKKTFVRVTDLVQPRLSVADSSVAKIVRGTVMGVSPGQTEVQVISLTGKLLGSKEIRVGSDKVEIERMVVNVISGMALHISEDRNLPGAIMATVHLRDLLVARQQEAVLDIAIQFRDDTVLPLFSVDPAEFDLKVTSVNPEVVEVAESVGPAPNLPPSIKAVGNGKGEIVRVILRESSSCNRKKPRTLDTEYVHVQVDFTKDMDLYNIIQSDGYYYNRASDRRHGSTNNQDHYMNKEEYFKQQQHNFNKQQQQQQQVDSSLGDMKNVKPGPRVYPLEKVYDRLETFTASDGLDENTKEPRSEALAQAVNTKSRHLSPLEIGMYVLVAVFVFAILVFTANCAVFMVRYQRKCSPKSSRVMVGSISQAPDWVWIGRATLERRGAGNTGCSHALMTEEDFNGNQMVAANSSSNDRQRQQLQQNTETSAAVPPTSSTSGVTGSSSSGSASNRNSVISTYKGSECSIRITSNPLIDEDCGMGYNEAEWDYEAMGMTYEQLMEYFENLRESSA